MERTKICTQVTGMTLKTCFSLPPSRACLEYRQVLPCIRNCYKLHSSTNQRAAQIQNSFSALLQNMHGEHKGKTKFGRKPMAHFGRSGELMLPSPRIKGRGLHKKSTKAAVLSKKEKFMHLDFFSHWILR